MRVLPRVLSCVLLLAASLPVAAAAPAASPDPLAKAAGAWRGTAEYGGGKFPVTLEIKASGSDMNGSFRVRNTPAPLTGSFNAPKAGAARRARVSVNVLPPLSFVVLAWPSPEMDVMLVDSALGKGRAEFYEGYSRCVLTFKTLTGNILAVLQRSAPLPSASKGGGRRKKRAVSSTVIPLQLQ